MKKLVMMVFYICNLVFSLLLIAQDTEKKIITKRVIIFTREFPTYTTQVITTLMMLKKLGYETYVYASRKMCSMAEHRIQFYDNLDISDVYERMYAPEDREIVIQKMCSNEFDLAIGMIGSCGLDIVNIKEKYSLDLSLLIKITGADIAQGYQGKKNKFKKAAKYVSWFLPVSEHFQDLLIKAGVPKSKVKVLPSVVLTNFFYPIKKIKNSNQFRILSIGRCIEKKGFDIAIKAVALLIKKYPFIYYDIVGNGKEEKKLLDLINQLDCKNNIHLIGKVLLPDIPNYYANSDILLVPSRIAKSGDMEGIPRVAKEAMAMNIPVIATDCSGVQEITKDRESAFIIRPNNVQDIVDAISEIVSNKKILKNIIKNARDIILRDHSLEAVFSIFKTLV